MLDITKFQTDPTPQLETSASYLKMAIKAHRLLEKETLAKAS